MAFVKGKSGNPSGRPKENKDVKELARRHSPDAFARILTLMKSDDQRVAFAAAQEVLNRAWGKPTTHIEADVTTRSVMRMPEPAATTSEWLEKYAGQKRDTPH